jgi:hypothetical protein
MCHTPGITEMDKLHIATTDQERRHNKDSVSNIKDMLHQLAEIENVLKRISDERYLLEESPKSSTRKTIPSTIFTVEDKEKVLSETPWDRLHRKATERQKRLAAKALAAQKYDPPKLCLEVKEAKRNKKHRTKKCAIEASSVHTYSTSRSMASTTTGSSSKQCSFKVKKVHMEIDADFQKTKQNPKMKRHDQDASKNTEGRTIQSSTDEKKLKVSSNVPEGKVDNYLSTFEGLYDPLKIHKAKRRIQKDKKLKRADDMYQLCLKQLKNRLRSGGRNIQFTAAVRLNYYRDRKPTYNYS